MLETRLVDIDILVPVNLGPVAEGLGLASGPAKAG